MHYLGIDGGGTKTAFRLISREKGIVSSCLCGPLFYMESGFDGVIQTVLEGTHSCCKTAGISSDSVISCFAGIPGYGEIESDMDRLTSSISHALGIKNTFFGNDVEAGLAGSLACQPGINIVAGTGSIACGKDETGTCFRSGGWAHHFGGDEGSAYWIGCRLIQEFTRQSDGRRQKTRLYQMIRDHFSLKNDFEILNLILNNYQMERSKIAALSLLTAEIALSGDKPALHIFEQASNELFQMIKAVKDNLRFQKSPVSVSYSGGVFNCGDLILSPLEKLADFDQCCILPPVFPPVTGACLLAFSSFHKSTDKNLISLLKEQNHDLPRP